MALSEASATCLAFFVKSFGPAKGARAYVITRGKQLGIVGTGSIRRAKILCSTSIVLLT